MDVEQFEKTYVRKVGIRKTLVEYSNGDCVFFDNQARTCNVYEARPRQCRTWPFWDSNLKSESPGRKPAKFAPVVGKGSCIPSRRSNRSVQRDSAVIPSVEGWVAPAGLVRADFEKSRWKLMQQVASGTRSLRNPVQVCRLGMTIRLPLTAFADSAPWTLGLRLPSPSNEDPDVIIAKQVCRSSIGWGLKTIRQQDFDVRSLKIWHLTPNSSRRSYSP